jgi:hypothetical protein
MNSLHRLEEGQVTTSGNSPINKKRTKKISINIENEHINNSPSGKDHNSFVNILKSKSKVKYSFMNFLASIMRECCNMRSSYKKTAEVYNRIDEKMVKVTSLENISKITRFVKLIGALFLEDYQKNVLKICPAPRHAKKENK